MSEPMLEKHYEEKFEFPLWKLIKQRAEEKDISYLAAQNEVLPEYGCFRHNKREPVLRETAFEKGTT